MSWGEMEVVPFVHCCTWQWSSASWNNSRLEGTSGIIWSKLPWEEHSQDKMAQHPVQLSLKSVQFFSLGRLLQRLIVLIVKVFPQASTSLMHDGISFPESIGCSWCLLQS